MKSVFRNIQTCLGTAFRRSIPRPSTPSAAYEGISCRNSEHASTAKPTTECWSLAASDLAPGLAGEIKTLLPACECKTGIYNTLQGQGSIGTDKGWWATSALLDQAKVEDLHRKAYQKHCMESNKGV